MRFPNAASGVKKIFTAQLLTLIGAVCLIVAAISVVVGITTTVDSGSLDNVFAGAGLAVLLFSATSVLSIIAFIFTLIGVNKARLDEDSFKSSLLFLIIYIAALVLSSVFNANQMGALSGVFEIVSDLAMLCVTIFIITGVIKLADKLGKSEVSKKGANVLKMIVVVYAATIVATLVSTVMGGFTATVVTGIIYVIVSILKVVQSVMYLLFLKDGKDMLAKF